MNAVGLFAMGVFVTLVVGAALGLLVYGAILDGRYAEEQKAEEALQPSPHAVAGHRPSSAVGNDGIGDKVPVSRGFTGMAIRVHVPTGVVPAGWGRVRRG